MRIAMIATGAHTTGGGEKHVLDLSRGLLESGHEVALIAPLGGDVLQVAEAMGSKTKGVHSVSPFSTQLPRALSELDSTLRPDIIHAHGPRAAYFVRRGYRQGVSRLVYTIHGIHAGHGALGSVKLAVERADRDKVAAYITTCQADLISGCELNIQDSSKTSVIYNGVPKPQEYPRGSFRTKLGISSQQPLVLHIGRASQPKDHPTLLTAFDLAWQRADLKPHLAMIVAGKDSQRKSLLRLAASLSCRSDITILPNFSPIGQTYTDANVFLMSSIWEARPYVIVESMSYGCPVVSTEVGGIKEAIASPDLGFLAPPANPQALADQLEKALAMTNQERSSYAQRASSYVIDNFSLKNMTSKTIDVYRKVLNLPLNLPNT